MITHGAGVEITAFGALLLSAVLSADDGFAQASFYQGKTITVVAGTAPGGIGDGRVKSLIPYLRKYIPGSPAIVVEYMDGGGGRQVGNHMARNARPDGLTIGAFSNSVISLNILRESGVMYDIDKFFYLGWRKAPATWCRIPAKEAGLSNLENSEPHRESEWVLGRLGTAPTSRPVYLPII